MTAATAERSPVWTAFRAILWRDIFVTGKEVGVFVAQVALQPFFMLFVFAKVLGAGGYVSADYGELLLPGIVGLTAFLTALQTVSFPLIMEFSWSREIEDRLLAPLPVWLVAVEKMLVAILRGLLAAAIMFPVGALVLGQMPWNPAGTWLLVGAILLGCWLGAAMGLSMGTLVPPNRISIMFAVILTPLMFTGAVQYPWSSLDSLPWFQVITLFNPLTYLAEAVRAAVVPQVPHIEPWISIAAMVATGAVFSWIGIRGFLRRAIS